MSSNRCRGFLALVLACLWGCQSDNLLLATHTKVGLDIALDGNTPTSAVFGYKRFEGAIVPVDPVEKDKRGDDSTTSANDGDTSTPAADAVPSGDDGKRTMESVFGALDVRNGWLNGMDIHQMLATGDAADALAKHPGRARELMRLLEGTEDASPDDDDTGGNR